MSVNVLDYHFSSEEQRFLDVTWAITFRETPKEMMAAGAKANHVINIARSHINAAYDLRDMGAPDPTTRNVFVDQDDPETTDDEKLRLYEALIVLCVESDRRRLFCGFVAAPRPGFEPGALRLTAGRSAN
jgi:hypothetical protein